MRQRCSRGIFHCARSMFDQGRGSLSTGRFLQGPRFANTIFEVRSITRAVVVPKILLAGSKGLKFGEIIFHRQILLSCKCVKERSVCSSGSCSSIAGRRPKHIKEVPRSNWKRQGMRAASIDNPEGHFAGVSTKKGMFNQREFRGDGRGEGALRNS